MPAAWSLADFDYYNVIIRLLLRFLRLHLYNLERTKSKIYALVDCNQRFKPRANSIYNFCTSPAIVKDRSAFILGSMSTGSRSYFFAVIPSCLFVASLIAASVVNSSACFNLVSRLVCS